MIVVSHDRYFLNKVPTRIVELSADGITSFLGGYDYYMEKKQSLGSGKSYLEELGQKAAAGPGSAESVNTSQEERRRAKEAQTQQKRLEKERKRLEDAIADTEAKIEWIQSEMCREEVYTDHQKIAAYQSDLNRLKDLLSETYEAWIGLHEEP
jgi:ATP-binding cassette subfamily F protein 3